MPTKHQDGILAVAVQVNAGDDEKAMSLLHDHLPDWILCGLECDIDRDYIPPLCFLRKGRYGNPHDVSDLSSSENLRLATYHFMTAAQTFYEGTYLPYKGYDLDWSGLKEWYQVQQFEWYGRTDWKARVRKEMGEIRTTPKEEDPVFSFEIAEKMQTEANRLYKIYYRVRGDNSVASEEAIRVYAAAHIFEDEAATEKEFAQAYTETGKVDPTLLHLAIYNSQNDMEQVKKLIETGLQTEGYDPVAHAEMMRLRISKLMGHLLLHSYH